MSDRINIPRSSGLDLEFSGALIGSGEFSPGHMDAGTRVRIYQTEAGNLVAHVHQWRGHTSSVDRAEAFVAPDALSKLLDWLTVDGKGKLGAASKAAYTEALDHLGLEEVEEIP